jgi:hypothetical protein
MVSIRRRERIEVPAHREEEPPVTSPPAITAAELPPAVEPKPPESPEKESPAELAGKQALKARLEEMERAEKIVSQAQQPPQQEPPPSQEPPQAPTLEEAIAGFHPRVQEWCRADPRLLTDPERIKEAEYCHLRAAREVGGEGTDACFDRMEHLLRFRRDAPSSNGHAKPRSEPPPPRQQQRSAAPVAAPPTREVPSVTTGRPATRMPPLTADERQIASQSRLPGQTQEQAEQTYQLNKAKMLQAKASGAIQ